MGLMFTHSDGVAWNLETYTLLGSEIVVQIWIQIIVIRTKDRNWISVHSYCCCQTERATTSFAREPVTTMCGHDLCNDITDR